MLINIKLIPCSVAQSCLFATLWTVALQAPLSMGLSRQEYWSGLPLPPPGDLLDPEIKPTSPALQADSLPTEPSVIQSSMDEKRPVLLKSRD